ncbi:hypothetical protein [Colwellia sp. E2M01]|uniref:hypothetical protein n=1 Tax=Colwellia sp. E2M01 TaxID=2841561 RepID=UPI001C08F0F5|nr:hypothetical protein [Colwellia sp. E2M01]MBU2869360.1 hypothetical protein [Colwellia sp. E2M01]
MNKKQVTLIILALLISIKFIYLPWSEWTSEIEDSTARLSAYNAKQQLVIENEVLTREQLEKHKSNFVQFIKPLPTIKIGDKANTLWFSLLDSVKSKDIKIYNQRVNFEEYVSDDVGYVTGTLYISGEPIDVIKAILKLEEQGPYVFLEQIKLNGKISRKDENLVAQLYLRQWFLKRDEVTND